jgi:hypothetical protein
MWKHHTTPKKINRRFYGACNGKTRSSSDDSLAKKKRYSSLMLMEE